MILVPTSVAFVIDTHFAHLVSPKMSTSTRVVLQAFKIDFQSDTTQFGRGEMHLSAMVNEGDVVVYQKGSWMVDGVVVGDGTTPTFEYCQVETIQLVWTHNCEHGVIRGITMKLEDQIFLPMEPLEAVEFGPEQLLARIPVQWNDNLSEARSLVDLKGGKLWQFLE